jgi:hypothetical protein
LLGGDHAMQAATNRGFVMSYPRFYVPVLPPDLMDYAKELVQEHPQDSNEYRLGDYLLNLHASLEILKDELREEFGDDLGEERLE